jgi:hypothetical protein
MVAYYDGGTTTTSGTSSVWNHWNNTTMTTSVTGGGGNTLWRIWVSPTTTSTATTLVWNTWVNGNNRVILSAPVPAAPALVLTPEQVESERVRREDRERLWKAQQAARKAAEDKAQELLMAHLTEAQREAIKARNFFIVEGGKSKEKYRIWTSKGVHGNIEKLDKAGKAVANLCVQLKETVCPNGDHFLAQKLMLELAEDDILKVANMTRMAA